AKRHNGRLMTEGSTRYRTCCIADRLVRARGLLRFGRLSPSSSAVTELRRGGVMCKTRGAPASLEQRFWDGARQRLMRPDGVTEGDVRAALSDARAVASGGTARRSGHFVIRRPVARPRKKSPGAGHRKQAQIHMMADV